jgi:hypothetical protein
MDCFFIIKIYVRCIRETLNCIYQTTDNHIRENRDFYNHKTEKFRRHTITIDLS